VSTVQKIVRRRVRAELRVDDVAWASTFRVHRRLVRRLAGRRRFLLGDAGHLSTPFAGEGLNAGLQDAQNLAWKLALVLHGRGRAPLLDSFAFERLAADRHVLEVSDQMNELVDTLVDPGRAQSQHPRSSPTDATEFARSRAMLDVSYAGSPIVGEYDDGVGEMPPGPTPGDRFPDRVTLDGTRHHLLLFGNADANAVERIGRRWEGLVDVVRAPGEHAKGVVLIRPDGFVAFRATPADSAGLAAVDSHLESYLVPN
jgi:4,5-epoxidase